jgi:DNA polymerase-3 subunit gamma/tau
LRPEQGQDKLNKPSLSLPEISLEKKVNTLEKPTGGISESTLSIKGQLEQIRQNKSIPESELPRTQFTSDALLAATRKYAHVLKNAGKETFYHALIKRDPVLSDEHITLIVDNEVQVAYINPNLQEFMDFLKTELKNGFITVEVTVTEQSEQDNKPVTGKDKYQALARKNPNIHTLKNRFNLDIEF